MSYPAPPAPPKKPAPQQAPQAPGAGLPVAPALGAYGLYEAYNALGGGGSATAATPFFNTEGIAPESLTAGLEAPTAGALSSLYPAGSAGEAYGTFGQAAAPIAGLAGGYALSQAIGNRQPVQGALGGAGLGYAAGAMIPALAGTGIGIPIAAGLLAGGLAGNIKAGKHEDQVRRDSVRAGLQQRGVLDGDFNIETAKGNRFNLGIDGGPRPEYGVNSNGQPIYAFNVQEDKPFSSQAVVWSNILSTILTGGDDKLRTDFSGYFTNAALSDTDNLEGVRANVLHFMEKNGLNQEQVNQQLTAIKGAGKLSDQEYQVLMHNADVLFRGLADNYNTETVAQTRQRLASMAPPAGAVPPGMPPPAPSGLAPIQRLAPGGTMPQLAAPVPGGAIPRVAGGSPLTNIAAMQRPVLHAQGLPAGIQKPVVGMKPAIGQGAQALAPRVPMGPQAYRPQPNRPLAIQGIIDRLRSSGE